MTSQSDNSGDHLGTPGLPTYEGLKLLADQMIARSARDGELISLVCLRIIASSWSDYPTGTISPNDLLLKVGALLSANLRASDVVARASEHELVVLLPDTGAPESRSVIERIAMVGADHARTVERSTTVEVGISTFEPSEPNCDLQALLDAARLEISFTNLRWEI